MSYMDEQYPLEAEARQALNPDWMPRMAVPAPSIPKAPVKEQDPTGRGQHEPGAKLDAGKQRPGLVLGGFAKALGEVTKVGTYGAQKYTPYGWQSVPDAMARYEDAMLRHWLAHKSGELNDPDTGINHLAHMAWNALALVHFAGEDDGR